MGAVGAGWKKCTACSETKHRKTTKRITVSNGTCRQLTAGQVIPSWLVFQPHSHTYACSSARSLTCMLNDVMFAEGCGRIELKVRTNSKASFPAAYHQSAHAPQT